MQLTYADRETVMRVLDTLKAEAIRTDDELLADIAEWAERLRPEVGFENALLRDITTLSHYLARLQEDDLKDIARGALNYALREHDLIPDDTPLLGLQDDAYIASLAVHEIRERLGEPTTYSPPRLTISERDAAERMFRTFLTQPLGTDLELIAGAEEFCDHMRVFSGSGFFGRLCRNVQFLRGCLERQDITEEHLRLARGALSYLHCEEDAIPDRMGLIGYLDDNFVVQTAVDLIEPGRDPWLNLLDAVAEVWPFINRLVFDEEGSSYPLSEFLIINSALSCDHLRPEEALGLAALVVPSVGPLPVVLGFIASLGLVEELARSKSSALTFQLGQRVIVDNDTRCVVTFGGFEEVGGRKMFRLRQSGTASRLWPVSHLRRLSPIRQARVPRGRLNFDQSTSDAPVSALEQLFFSDAPLQVGQIPKKVVIVTSVASARTTATTVSIFGQRLMEIVPIGHLRSDGDLELWTSRFGEVEPLLIVVPDLDRARELIESRSDISKVVVDGPVARKSASMAAIAAAGVPVLAVVADVDHDAIEFLEQKQFRFWDWEGEDIHQLFWPQPSPNGHTPAIYKFENRVVRAMRETPTVWNIPSPTAERALEALTQLQKVVKARGPEESLVELDAAVSVAFDVFFRLLHSLRPSDGQPDPVVTGRLKELERLYNSSFFITAEERQAAQTARDVLRDFALQLGSHNEKRDLLAEMVRESPASTVVCRDVGEAEQLKGTFDSRTTLLACNACPPELDGPAIILGWYSRYRMERLLMPPVASPLTLVLFDVEKKWYEALLLRQNRARARRASRSSRGSFFRAVEGWSRKVPQVVTQPPRADEPSPLDVVEEFDRTATENRRRRALEQARATSTEPSVEAWPVFFADGSHAFLTDSYQAKVVTHLLTGNVTRNKEAEVQLLSVDRLDAGDVLLFLKGESRDVIREVADRMLPPGTRSTALLWQSALRRFAKANDLTPEKVWKRLKAGGCTHHPATVRYWLESDDIIAPRDAHDHELKLIAEVTRDPELLSRLTACDEAVSDVWGAHLRASHHLAEQVIARTADYLSIGAELTELVEVERGVVLARIEHIELEPVMVRRGSVNRLLEGR